MIFLKNIHDNTQFTDRKLLRAMIAYDLKRHDICGGRISSLVYMLDAMVAQQLLMGKMELANTLSFIQDCCIHFSLILSLKP